MSEALLSKIFSGAGLLVLPFWALMILAPRWSWTSRLLRSPLVVVPPALLYAALVLPEITRVLPAVMQPKLPEIAALLATPLGATVGWVHFLAFDLFVGRWVFLDARARGLSPWIVSPILFFVLMLGPLGFVAYCGVAALHKRAPASATR